MLDDEAAATDGAISDELVATIGTIEAVPVVAPAFPLLPFLLAKHSPLPIANAANASCVIGCSLLLENSGILQLLFVRLASISSDCGKLPPSSPDCLSLIVLRPIENCVHIVGT